jgi:hypothetical protein
MDKRQIFSNETRDPTRSTVSPNGITFRPNGHAMSSIYKTEINSGVNPAKRSGFICVQM